MRIRSALLVLVALVLLASYADAHVPFFELKDFDLEAPFRPELPEQSIAVYAWLEGPRDVDVYVVTLTKETPFLAEVLVPVHPRYETFRPAFAVIGKGLPKAPSFLPVWPLEGYGALVFLDDVRTKRETFYEPFGGKSYYQGPRFERTLPPGTYAVVCWDPRHQRGDYVAVLGRKEIWRGKDMLRALRLTPQIRRGRELHLNVVECDEAAVKPVDAKQEPLKKDEAGRTVPVARPPSSE